ncbi:hypothetical protein M4I32_11810 [Microbacterium sp. LRZ72]|uniref:hypothetical protein n=1 Tax=Microbacterium sp. LRZ72 TaxID=2942481 RepID=UPI0029AFBEC5|nr:hypothetical protein [Microbacterium sp. LRZ72]MDX2377486.1 hypothetical protein [Microbacterium sp. LRZ72]
MPARETTGAPARAAARRERAARRMLRRRRVVAGVGAAALVAGLGGAAVFGAMADGREVPDAGAPASASPAPPAASALPTPRQTGSPAAPDPLCERAEVQRALADGDDAAVIEAAGGGEGFRRAVADEAAPCTTCATRTASGSA